MYNIGAVNCYTTIGYSPLPGYNLPAWKDGEYFRLSSAALQLIEYYSAMGQIQAQKEGRCRNTGRKNNCLLWKIFTRYGLIMC